MFRGQVPRPGWKAGVFGAFRVSSSTLKEVAIVPASGVDGNSNRSFGAEDTQQGGIAIDGFGQGEVVGKDGSAWRGVVGLVGIDEIRSLSLVVISNGYVGTPDGPIAAEDVIQGVGTKAVAAKILLIVGIEVEGAIFLEVAVVAGRAFRDRFGRLRLVAANIVGDAGGTHGAFPMPLAIGAPGVNAIPVVEAGALFSFNFSSSYGLSLRLEPEMPVPGMGCQSRGAGVLWRRTGGGEA